MMKSARSLHPSPNPLPSRQRRAATSADSREARSVGEGFAPRVPQRSLSLRERDRVRGECFNGDHDAKRSSGPMQSGRDGFILVAVLWIIGGLAALASIYAVYVSNSATAVAINEDKIRAQGLTSAALELAAYQLLVAPEKATHGAFNFRTGRASTSVEFRSEAARIDLNTAPKELLAGLWRVLGAEPGDADQYADRIIGWRTPPASKAQDKEGSLYGAAGLAYGPRGAPFAHTGELWLVYGLPPELVEGAMRYVTVFSGITQVDILNAAPEVIAALPKMTPERLNDVLAQRANLRPGDSAAALLGPVPHAVTTGSKATRITIRSVLGNGRRMMSEAVILIDGKDEPFRVLSWQDGIDAQTGPDFKTGALR
jgi:general secretion pathway protein K